MELPDKEKRLAVRNKPETGEPLMYQKWKNILSLNWEYPADELQKRLPDGLIIDTFNGNAYLGITMLFMEEVRPKYLPAFPGVSNFQEVNFRTYVFDKNGTPGIWFFSLDAGNRIAVEAAKILINLPYNYSYIKTQITPDNQITFSAMREDLDPKLLSYFRYAAKEGYRTAESDTLDFFLIERYALFTHQAVDNEIFSGRVYHAPYILKDVELIEWDDNLFEANGFQRPARFPDHAAATPDLNVEFYMLKKV